MASPDINDLALLDEVVEVDSAASSEEFFNPPLPDDGEHLVLMKMGDRGVKAQRQWEGKGASRKQTGAAFLNVHLQLKALADNGGEGGTIAFDQLTTLVMANAGTSRVHAAFDLAGFRLTERTLGGLKAEIERAVAQNPQVTIVTRWEAQENVGTKDSPDYLTVLVGQKNFPQGENGKYSPEVVNPKTGNVVRAQVRVVKYARP